MHGCVEELQPIKTKGHNLNSNAQWIPGTTKLGLNRIEAAAAIGVSPATLDRLTLRGLLRPSRATRRPIYAVKELERFLKDTTSQLDLFGRPRFAGSPGETH